MSLKSLRQNFRFLRYLAIARATGKKVPLIVVLCVTNRCNLNCWYCYGEHHYRSGWREFTGKELVEIVRELGRLGTVMLQLQGGEPLLRDDLASVINAAKKFGMTCDMVTNGVLLPARKDILGLLDRICISLDGPQKLNDFNRGEGAFSAAVRAIDTAIDSGIPVRISAVLTSDTEFSDIDWLLEFARQKRVLVNFSPSFGFLAQARNDGFFPHPIPEEKLRSLLMYIADRKSKGHSVQFSAKSYALAGKWPFRYEKCTASAEEVPGSGFPRCIHGDYVVFIDSEGSVYPCCNFWGRQKLNVRSEGVAKCILQLDRASCSRCYIPAYIDRNLFFNIEPATWVNYLKHSLRGES